MTSRSDSGTASRGLGSERGVLTVVGVIALLGGVAALAAGAGWLGVPAQRRILEPLVQWWHQSPQGTATIGFLLGIALVLLGLLWLVRALRPESRPDVRLESSGGALTVTSTALADAVRADAETIRGVVRARARMTGPEHRPHLRLVLSLQEGARLRDVWDELDGKVLSRARQALQTEAVPTTVLLRLNRAPRQRVR